MRLGLKGYLAIEFILMVSAIFYV